MDQQKSIHLFLKGAEAWNQWARRLLKRKRQLISKGLWQVSSEFDWETGYFRTIGLNEESQIWLERSRANFTDLEFMSGDNVSNKTKARHRQDKTFAAEKFIPNKGINIDFRGFIFPGDAVFSNSDFNGIALFNDAIFHQTAWFNNATFLEELWFLNTHFKGDASFHQVVFKSFTTFENALFTEGSNFESLKSERSFDLSGAIFKNDVPSFIDAEFTQPPRLINIKILPLPIKNKFSQRLRNVLGDLKSARNIFRKFTVKDLVISEWLGGLISHKHDEFFNARRKPQDEASYRALRAMALQAGDHRNARAFYAKLVKSRRHLIDKPSNIPGGLTRYLYGIIYELTSNFGRSMSRPVLTSLIVFYAFSMVYLSTAKISPLDNCVNDPHQTPYQAARTLAYHNAILLTAENRQQSINKALTCLNVATPTDKKRSYNFWQTAKKQSTKKDQSRLMELEEDESQLDDDELYTASINAEINHLNISEISDGGKVSHYNINKLSMLQIAIHLILISLFLYGVRNHIRMK